VRWLRPCFAQNRVRRVSSPRQWATRTMVCTGTTMLTLASRMPAKGTQTRTPAAPAAMRRVTAATSVPVDVTQQRWWRNCRLHRMPCRLLPSCSPLSMRLPPTSSRKDRTALPEPS